MKKLLLLFPLVLFPLQLTWAQEEQKELEVIEAELKKSTPKKRVRVVEPEANVKDESVLGLSNLSPYSEVIVIQKKFLPRTERFQLFGGGTFITNDPFFIGIGFNGRFSYSFTEAWAAEILYFALTSSEREVIGELKDKQGVNTTAFVTVKEYIGADIQWTPIVGKMSWFNNRIVPFDLYFSIGGGQTTTKDGQSSPTLHLGTGQIFAIDKSLAFRWDFSWNFFSAKSSAASSTGTSQSFNALFLTAGISFFFPEAKYR